jgi:hypothetical protein
MESHRRNTESDKIDPQTYIITIPPIAQLTQSNYSIENSFRSTKASENSLNDVLDLKTIIIKDCPENVMQAVVQSIDGGSCSNDLGSLGQRVHAVGARYSDFPTPPQIDDSQSENLSPNFLDPSPCIPTDPPPPIPSYLHTPASSNLPPPIPSGPPPHTSSDLLPSIRPNLQRSNEHGNPKERSKTTKKFKKCCRPTGKKGVQGLPKFSSYQKKTKRAKQSKSTTKKISPKRKNNFSSSELDEDENLVSSDEVPLPVEIRISKQERIERTMLKYMQKVLVGRKFFYGIFSEEFLQGLEKELEKERNASSSNSEEEEKNNT